MTNCNCHYTSETEHEFNTQCYDNCPNINIYGVYPQDKISSAMLYCNSATDKWVQFDIPEVCDIPTVKPDMEGIVSVNSCLQIISKRVVNTPKVEGYTIGSTTVISGNTIPNAEGTLLTGKKLVIEGLLKQKVIYTALYPDQPLHSASFAVPFSVFIIVPENTALTQSFNVEGYIEDIYASMLSPRSVFKNTTIFIKAIEVK